MSIKTYGEPVLRQKAEPVAGITGEVKKLIEEMKKTMCEAKGVGLAANQIGIPKSFFIAQLAREDEVRAFFNPNLLPLTDETEKTEEGCLSIPGIWVEVPRYLKVRLTARDIEGNPVAVDLEGLPARIVQHEIDHLNGVLIIDRISLAERRRIAKELAELKTSA
ncbi:peptide deformylase [candidate division WOR-3 bacterium]|uniref:Peptide deformylase n=1 Tax=candidate division WOR-3 bacterium TaxID=2052148 RepID=A0A9D5KB40_UNCW3|nr:peptide deformylase [candidate division WOR-3 bacterium]MBD3364506.1 peptide deformylase [candidate division WOR-3 bacterium]